MRWNRNLVLALGASFVLIQPATASADEHHKRREGHGDRRYKYQEPACQVDYHVERPSWVMVFSLGHDGRLDLLSSGRTGTYVSPHSRYSGVSCDPGHHSSSCRFEIVVYSDAPFALPPGFARQHRFRVDKHGWDEAHSRKLCRMIGVRPERVRVVVHRTEVRSLPVCDHVPSLLGAQLWAGITSGGRVYVDGAFRGSGVEALLSVEPGRRRISVVTTSGHKYSDWVAFPVSACEPYCYEQTRMWP